MPRSILSVEVIAWTQDCKYSVPQHSIKKYPTRSDARMSRERKKCMLNATSGLA